MCHLLTSQKTVSCTFLWGHKKLNHHFFSHTKSRKNKVICERQMSCSVLLMNTIKTDEVVRRSAGSGTEIDRLKAFSVTSLTLPKQIRRGYSVTPIRFDQFCYILCLMYLIKILFVVWFLTFLGNRTCLNSGLDSWLKQTQAVQSKASRHLLVKTVFRFRL